MSAKVVPLPRRGSYPRVEPPVEQRVALVTGASRGLGLEVARQLAARGVTVFMGLRDLPRGRDAIASVRALGSEVHALKLDVTRQRDIDQAMRRIEAMTGRLDILVNNAGGVYDTRARPSEGDMATLQQALDVNLSGAWRVTSAALPLMRRHGYGRVVNVSSQCGIHGMCGDGAPAYRVSKAALNAYTQVLAREMQGSGILVNAVCPGWTATDLGGPGGRAVTDGAAGIVWAALMPDGESTTGAFFVDGKRMAW